MTTFKCLFYTDFIDLLNLFITDFSTINTLQAVCTYLNKYKFNVRCNDKQVGQMYGMYKNITIVSVHCSYGIHLPYLPSSLTYLNCYYACIDASIIKSLHNLKTLVCGVSSKLTDDSVACLTSLTYLDCGCNYSLSDLSLKCLTNLTYLDCWSNGNFTDLSLKCLTNLTHLDCGCNESFTDASLVCLTSLTYLNCGFNELFTDSSLKCLTSLTYLDQCDNTNFSNDCLSSLSQLVCI